MEPALLRRHGQRGVYDIESAKAVFDDCFLAHVSYVVDGFPACMPMIALIMDGLEDEECKDKSAINGLQGRGRDENRKTTAVYLHGHPSTKLMELVRASERSPGEETNGDNCNDGHTSGAKSTGNQVTVCITATKVDGLALSSAPNGHTFNYRSATIHGTCESVRSKIAKRAIMRAVTNKIVDNRWNEVNPVASTMVSLVFVVKVNIDSLSVKTRTGVPGIQPRNVEVDGPDIETPPWTGVVPVWETLGEPVESGLTPDGVVSESLKEYIESRNKKHETYAKSAAK